MSKEAADTVLDASMEDRKRVIRQITKELTEEIAKELQEQIEEIQSG